MWLQDPYVVDQWLRRHAEQLAGARQGEPAATRNGSRFPERAVLALRVLVDGALAARVSELRGEPLRAPEPVLPAGDPTRIHTRSS